MNKEKLYELETTIAHQDQQIQDLSEMVAQQWEKIEALQSQLAHLQRKINIVEDRASFLGAEEAMSGIEFAALQKPPHY